MEGKDKNNSRLILKVSVILMIFIAIFVVGFAYTVYLDYTKTKDNSHVVVNTISQNENYQYQIEVTKFMEDLVEYTKQVYDPILLKQVTNGNRDSLLDVSIDFRDRVENFNPIPSTDRDRKFENRVYDLKTQSDDLVYYAIKYISDEDVTFKSLFLEAYNDLNITLKSIAKLETELY